MAAALRYGYRGSSQWREPVLAGREQQLDSLRRVVAGPRGGRLWVAGPPGSGKRALVAHGLGLPGVLPDGCDLCWIDAAPADYRRTLGTWQRLLADRVDPAPACCVLVVEHAGRADLELLATLVSPDCAATIAIDVAVPADWHGEVVVCGPLGGAPLALWWPNAPADCPWWHALGEQLQWQPWALAIAAAQARNAFEAGGPTALAEWAAKVVAAPPGTAADAWMVAAAIERAGAGAGLAVALLAAAGGTDRIGCLAAALGELESACWVRLSQQGLVQVRACADAPFLAVPSTLLAAEPAGPSALQPDWPACHAHFASVAVAAACEACELPSPPAAAAVFAELPRIFDALLARRAVELFAALLDHLGLPMLAAGCGDIAADAAELAAADADERLAHAGIWALGRVSAARGDAEMARAWLELLPVAAHGRAGPPPPCHSRFAENADLGAALVEDWFGAAEISSGAAAIDAVALARLRRRFPPIAPPQLAALRAIDRASVAPPAQVPRAWSAAQAQLPAIRSLARRDEQAHYLTLAGQIAARAGQLGDAGELFAAAAARCRACHWLAGEIAALNQQAAVLAATDRQAALAVQARLQAAQQLHAAVGDPWPLRQHIAERLQQAEEHAAHGEAAATREALQSAAAACDRLQLPDGEPLRAALQAAVAKWLGR